jgi:hypothetical protein
VNSILSRRPLTIVAVAATTVWIAAGSAAYAAGWQVSHPPYTAQSNVPYAPLAAITAVSANDVWAVGRADGAALTEHWTGTNWLSVPMPAGPCDVFESSCELTGVSASPAGDIFAVGTATLNASSGWLPTALAYRWTGQAWLALPVPASVNPWALAHVKTFAANDVWAVGQGTGGGPVPAATHWEGTAWSAVAVPDTSGLLDIAVTSANDAWALGFDGAVLHWGGATWAPTGQQFNGAKVIAAAAATDVWVAGAWTGSAWAVGHYDGTAWSTSVIPADIDTFTGASALAGGRVWFSGAYYAPPNGAATAPAILSE